MEETKISFDEFKLYYESTEKVTDRRLETNRWNYSVCIAILIASASIANWTFTSLELKWIGLCADFLLSVMAILFCLLWIGQIRDFKNLNNAKFQVLSEMAARVDFNMDKPGTVISFRPFDKEWDKLIILQATQEVGRSNIVALKSSNIEYYIPKAFAALFFAILLAQISLILIHWPPSSLSQLKPAVPIVAVPGRAP